MSKQRAASSMAGRAALSTKRAQREDLEALKRKRGRLQNELDHLTYLTDDSPGPEMLSPGQGPSAALDEQHRLARWWPSDYAHTFSKGWGESFSKPIEGTLAKKQAAEQLDGMRNELAAELRVCPTYSVTADMVTVVEAAAASFPGQPLYREDLPSPNGFVLLDRPLELLDIREKPLRFLAFAWHTTPITRLREDGTMERARPGIYLTMYSDLKDVLAYDEGADQQLSDEPTRAKRYLTKVMHPTHLSLMHVHGIVFGHEYDLGQLNILQNHLAFIEALFALMQQRITVAHHWEAPRQQRRQLERATGEPPTVRIVTLRRERQHDTDDDHEPGYVEWSHRWMVSGHWRRLWSEERQQTRLVWVNPYIKGPEDKPLVVKDTVYRLSR